jgi:hypothetical protein
MISSMRERFGTAGLIVAIFALVVALSGGAYAASGGGLTGKQKKEVEKIAKKFAGKPGPAGANGTNGANGANGTNGAAGPQGPKGDPGLTGFTSVLPKGSTETGTWASAYEEVGLLVGISFSIPLKEPLDAAHVIAEPLGYNGEDENCPGTVAAPKAKKGYLCVYTGGKTGSSAIAEIFDPSTGTPVSLGGSATEGAATTGAGLALEVPGYIAGTWAVTAP